MPESVWDYPRPPRLEPTPRRIRVVVGGVILADTHRALRLLETSHPPTYYLPPDDVRMDLLRPATGSSFCEWKGQARYLEAVVGERRVLRLAWTYDRPNADYAALARHLAFYASRVDEAWVDDEQVVPQPGDFYGGWITSDLVGPFKGGPGTSGW